jgi:hypothetical protein
MQAWSQIIDASLTYDALKDLGAKLKLPPGWKYRTRQCLTVISLLARRRATTGS